MNSTISNARESRDEAVEAVSSKGVWSPRRITVAVAVIALLVGMPPLTAVAMETLAEADLGVLGIAVATGVALALGAGVLIVTRRGTGGRHRA